MVQALVTGGTGFVGSHIARQLIAAGHTARVLRRINSSMLALEGVEVESAMGDVTDRDSLALAMRGCEWVFHVAAVADYWRADKARMYHVNIDGARNVFEAALAAGVRRVVFTSSGAAVGLRRDGTPADESVQFNLDPRRCPYGHTKFLAEAEALRAVRRGLEVVIVNPAIIMGPGDVNQISGSTVIELARGRIPAIPAGGADFIDVRDVAAMHIAAAERGVAGERYILGAANSAWSELIPLAARTLRVRAPFVRLPVLLTEPLALAVDALRALRVPLPLEGNQVRLSAKPIYYDHAKAHRDLVPPQVPIPQMIADTYAWYDAHGMI